MTRTGSPHVSAHSTGPRRLAIDLTPMSPGGENGGSRVMALALIPRLSVLLPSTEILLLTSGQTYSELAYLDAPTTRRVRVPEKALSVYPSLPNGSTPSVSRRTLRARLRHGLPPAIERRASNAYATLRRRLFQPPFLRSLRVDAVYCPFTLPFYADGGTPIVATVHDLQYRDLPDFFTPDQRFSQQRHFLQAAQAAHHLACVSDFTRRSVTLAAPFAASRASTIHLSVLDPLPTVAAEPTLTRLGLHPDRYLLYPANFWAHKNHAMLLTAFGIYRSQHPDADMRVVCPGVPNQSMDYLREAAAGMGLGPFVTFPGFVSRSDLAALFRACRAVVFPSLYEGFGMPVLEGLSLGKPVACSSVTSLPEVAGDAALSFNPRNPYDVARCIGRVLHDDELRRVLGARGPQRAALFGDADDMAAKYAALIQDVWSRAQTTRSSGHLT